MFCYQCEQTAVGKGCTKIGVCGKDEDIQSLQDTLPVKDLEAMLGATQAAKA
jgi:hydroxylamine reductase (hybrid-cluster protein)